MAKKTLISDFCGLKGKVTFTEKTFDARMTASLKGTKVKAKKTGTESKQSKPVVSSDGYFQGSYGTSAAYQAYSNGPGTSCRWVSR